MYACIHIYIYTYTYAYIYIYMYICIFILRNGCPAEVRQAFHGPLRRRSYEKRSRHIM